MAMFDLKGKSVVVTGAARGIGKATADLLAASGCTVARLDVEEGTGILACDVSDEKSVEQAFAQVGRVDILVNNAGVEPHAPLLDMDEWDWQRTLEVNLSAPLFTMQHAGREMRQQGGGAIVNIASMPGVPTA